MKNSVTYADLVRAVEIDYEKIGKVSAKSVLKHTGKNWKQWVEILDRASARSWTHKELVDFLKKKHRLTLWWQQGVALGYQIAIGRRKEGQDAKGKYMVTATKSLHSDAREVWKTLVSPPGLQVWLKPLFDIVIRPKVQFETSDGYFGEIRTIAPFRRVRLTWQDPLWEKHTNVELLLVSKPGKKSILVFNHTGILEAKTQNLLRPRWRNAADQIFQLLDKS